MLQKYIILLFLTICLVENKAYCIEKYQHILNETCYTKYETESIKTIKDPDIIILKEAIGIIIRFEIKNPIEESYCLSTKIIYYLKEIEKFLAKIKKSAIIEVHTEVFALDKRREFKNWELSILIANKIENYLIQNSSTITKNNIKSIGYGEFMPAKNTPNNGGKYSNRVDIIIPCSINGE
jgi:hypothetical protein